MDMKAPAPAPEIDVTAAAARIAPYIRRTPVMDTGFVREPITSARLWLKLDNLQVTGSFKARGAINFVLSQPPGKLKNGLVAASGGNHGMAVSYAARVAKTKATVFVSANVPRERIRKLEDWGADVRIEGATFEEAFTAAEKFSRTTNAILVPTFSDPAVVAGQGTVGLEILEQMQPDIILVAVGGGGLIGGLACAVKERRPNCRVIGIEPAGAARFTATKKAGHIVTLAEANTAAASIAMRTTTEFNYGLIKRYVDDMVTVSDEAMIAGAVWLWRECSTAAEMSGGATIAALQSGAVKAKADETVCALVCGGGRDGLGN